MNLKVPFPLRSGDVLLYRWCEELTAALLAGMVVFGPWAFGTTEPWSIRVMNLGGYGLGLLLAVKLCLRWLKGYNPGRWDERDEGCEHWERWCSRQQVYWSGDLSARASTLRASGWHLRLTCALALLTLLVLGWCLVSALNARATYHPDQLRFEYHDCIRWLPHSFDRTSSWAAFWTYLGLACAFWAGRDWILGQAEDEVQSPKSKVQSPKSEDRRPKTEAQSPMDSSEGEERPRVAGYVLPARLRWLLWLLALNGTLLSVEGLAQRLANSPKLLFLVRPQIHQTADTQFGPYAYRSNAAQYFNLVWPLCVGFWWTLYQVPGRVRRSSYLLLVCAALMAASSIISASRVGALVAIAIGVIGAVLLTLQEFLWPRSPAGSRAPRLAPTRLVTLFLASALALGLAFAWTPLQPRLSEFELNTGFASREELAAVGRRIAADCPVFGTGPGTYESVSELYRPAALINRFFPAEAHNDWLETRVTFGWMGSLMIYAMLGIVGLRWFCGGGIHGPRRFVTWIWLALAGCLLEARYDFPFQIHSVLFVFLLLCAVLFCLSKR